jgi:hypothetical protein
MYRPRVLLAFLLMVGCFGGTVQQAQTGSSPWAADAAKRRQELIDTNGPGSDAGLQAKLLAMRDADEGARGLSHGEAKDKEKLQMASNMAEIDGQLTAELKEIVAKSGWPTIKLVGIDASSGAMLVLTHTQDHAWQLSLLPLLTKLADEGRIDGAPLAIVVDKELVSEGKLQRYGTQFTRVADGMAMYGVENPGELDAERAKVGLSPLDVYKRQLEAMFHLKATGKIVMAPVQVAK